MQESRPEMSFTVSPGGIFKPTQAGGLAALHPALGDELTLLKLTRTDRHHVIFRWYLDEQRLEWSDNLTHVFPCLAGQSCETLGHWISQIHPDDRASFAAIAEAVQQQTGSFSLNFRIIGGNGSAHPVTCLATTKPDGTTRPEYILGVLHPTTLHPPVVSAEQANHAKPLPLAATQAYPSEFVEHLNHIIHHAHQKATPGTLLIIALNNLAMIVNSYGHQNSEAIVRSLCATLQEQVGDHDHIGRISRDQIGVILPGCSGEEAEKQAQYIYNLIQNYGMHAPVGMLHVTCSIVTVEFPSSAKNAIDALDKGYIAIHSNQTGLRSFDDVKQDLIQSRQHMGLANYLRRAIQDNRLSLAYQPIVESATGAVAHYEALLRVVSEEGNISSAGPLIPVAERMGLIEVVDQMVLEMVAQELAASPATTLAFNVSGLTTDNPKWLARFHALMKQYPTIAPRMIIEITETSAQRDLRQTAYFVASIQSTGAQVALDDFGSGYTSFRQLKALSVDMVKIDGAFIKDLTQNVDNRFFVKTLLDFTNGFGLKAVAEYVESGEIAKLLLDLGVGYLQGYYFGKPEPGQPWRVK